MDEKFKRKSNAVFEALGTIAKAEPSAVFLGGSAIQAILSKTRRLSIDLDLSFNQDAQRLIQALEAVGFTVSRRQSKNPIFEFYRASKEGVEIKLDICHFNISPTEHHLVNGVAVQIPRKSYFLAAKLSSLAFGTIGRQDDGPTQIIKDIFDTSCLLDEHVEIRDVASDWKVIVSDQNQLRNTSFQEMECARSVQQTLLQCLSLASTPFIPLNALNSFNEYLLSGQFALRDFVVMSARALMLLAHMDSSFYRLEAQVDKDVTNKLKVSQAEQELLTLGILPQPQLHELKAVAPKALLYLKYWLDSQGKGAAADGAFNFENLDRDVRRLMKEEVEFDVKNGSLYFSKRFNEIGNEEYPRLLLAAIEHGDDRTLASSLRDADCFKTIELRRGKPVPVPVTAPETLAEDQFNRFYMRALCRKVMEGPKKLQVYRAKSVGEPRADSELVLGTNPNPESLLKDLRENMGVEAALHIPGGPNSGISVRIIG